MQHTFIVLIPVGEDSGISHSRKASEQVEGTVFETDNVVSNYTEELKAKLLFEWGLEKATFEVTTISNFMSRVNDGEDFNLDNYFFSYVYLKVNT